MTKQVTITLSDGTPHTGTLDPDGFLLLPRGKKPAEPWWSRCEADPQGQSDKPHGLSPIAVPVPCGGWEWHDDEWFRIRPLPGESWESIAPQQPAAPKRDYTNWQEGKGYTAKPDGYDLCPEAYEVEYLSDGGAWKEALDPCWNEDATYRVRKRPAPARDYTNWQEGKGDSAKPEDYDQQPGKYEVEQRHLSGFWGTPIGLWKPGLPYRVRLRQSDPKCQKQEPSTATGMVALWCEPGTTAVTELPVVWRKPQPEQQSAETDGEFMRRVLLPCICRIGVAKGAEHVEFNTTRLDRADALRLARIIAEAKP